jgi:hypothetical protein
LSSAGGGRARKHERLDHRLIEHPLTDRAEVHGGFESGGNVLWSPGRGMTRHEELTAILVGFDGNGIGTKRLRLGYDLVLVGADQGT